MKTLLIILVIIQLTEFITSKAIINDELDDEWQFYKIKFNKTYTESDDLKRKRIWKQNLKYIQDHNVKYDLGHHSHSLGINDFSDLTTEEFRKLYLSPRNVEQIEGIDYLPPLNIKDLPDHVDWRTKGFVTNVKNQGQCGSCWAFSTTGSLEGQHFRKYRVLQNISEQQLVDCASKNYGCNGGWMNIAFEYISHNGIESENNYPYKAIQGKCVYNESKVVVRCKGFQNVKTQNEKDLAVAVATVGPISVAINAGESFQHYKQGIYYEPSCDPLIQNHAVLVVGYGVEKTNQYWIVKNSWGTSWGMNGYIQMSKDRNNNCGIATTASFPIV